MTQKIINLGQLPNGTGGDTNRSANVKCNENFTELYGKMAEKGANKDITALSGLTSALSISQGGTGAKTAADACRNIEAVGLGLNNRSFATRLSNDQMPTFTEITKSGMDNSGPLAISNDGNKEGSSVITFHRVRQFACHFGLDTDNQLKVGGHSMGPKGYRIYHEGNTWRSSDGTLKAI